MKTMAKWMMMTEQAVVVDGRYTYVWRGKPKLKQGERVQVEGKSPGSRYTGFITSLKPTYTGPMKAVLARADDGAQPDALAMTDRRRPDVDRELRQALGAQMKRQYERGKSLRDLSTLYEVSFHTVRTLLMEQNVEFRTRGGS